MFFGVAADSTRAAMRWWRWKRKTLRKENPCGDKGKGMDSQAVPHCWNSGSWEIIFIAHTTCTTISICVKLPGKEGRVLELPLDAAALSLPPIPRLQAVPTKGVETWQAQSEELRVGAELSSAPWESQQKGNTEPAAFPGSPQGWGICSPAQLWGLLTAIPLKCPNSLWWPRSLHAGTRSSPSSGSKKKSVNSWEFSPKRHFEMT